MPIYEFQCPRGHVTEKLVKVGTEEIICDHERCTGYFPPEPLLFPTIATRILSPTPTTFVHAGGRKL